MSAGNQQERLDALWIVGFVDGEGCFHVGINRQPAMSVGWQVLPEFRLVQHQRDEQILDKVKEYFGFGRVVVNHGDRKEWRVRRLQDLQVLCAFFRKHPLRTKKQFDFELFDRVLDMMQRKDHLTNGGLDTIAKLARQMNTKVNPKYLESSETIRRKHSS